MPAVRRAIAGKGIAATACEGRELLGRHGSDTDALGSGPLRRVGLRLELHPVSLAQLVEGPVDRAAVEEVVDAV